MAGFWNKLPIFHKLLGILLLICLIPLMIASLSIYRTAAQSLDAAATEFASAFASQMVAFW